MELKEAIERASKDGGVKNLSDYILYSCFACIKKIGDPINEWTLLYYNKKKDLMLDCFVNDRFITLGDETPPITVAEGKPDFSDTKININDALETASKNFNKTTINVLITLHKNPLIWTINLITQDMMATTFDIDARTGKTLKEESTSLIRKL